MRWHAWLNRVAVAKLFLFTAVGTCLLVAGARTSSAVAPAEQILPQGWWVPETLKLPRAAQGRLAWRFTPREIITVTKDFKLERRPTDLVGVKPRSWKASQPMPMLIEQDEQQGTLTVTFLGGKSAFFTLNPAGTADIRRFDSLVVDTHADVSETDKLCDKVELCCRIAGTGPDCAPKNSERSMSRCTEMLNNLRQNIAGSHRPIPSACR